MASAADIGAAPSAADIDLANTAEGAALINELQCFIELKKFLDRSVAAKDTNQKVSILRGLYEMALELDALSPRQYARITVTEGTALYRTYNRSSLSEHQIPNGIVFCNVSLLGNLFIRNPGEPNDTVAILTPTRDITLINFLPVSLLLGLQLKTGKGDSEGARGIFSACCEYKIITQFCREIGVDGIILSDHVDFYPITNSPDYSETFDTGIGSAIDKSTRTRLDGIAIEDIIEKRAFPFFINNDNVSGAIYPELIILNEHSKLSIKEGFGSIPMQEIYSPAWCRTTPLTGLIPILNRVPFISRHKGAYVVSENIMERLAKAKAYIPKVSMCLPYYGGDFMGIELDLIHKHLSILLKKKGGQKSRRKSKRIKKSFTH